MRPLGLLLASTLWLASPASIAAAADYLELLEFRLIDGTGAAPRHVDRLVARDGVIVRIDAAGAEPEVEPGARWTRIDLDGASVIPGLIDTHVHVARFADTRARAEQILRAAVRGGVTTVRDLAGDARALAELERATTSGELLASDLVFSALFGGPDIFVSGPTSEFATGRAPGDAPWARRIDDATDIPLAVAMAKGSGARNLKLYGDLSPTLIRALVAEAKRQQLETTAHATVFPARPSDLVDAGIGSLSHAAYLVWEAVDAVPDDYRQRTAGPWTTIPADHPRLLALYRRMAERGVTLDATLYVYRAMQDYPGVPKMAWTEQAAAWGEAATRHAQAAGVRITAGTDWFEPSHDGDLPHTHAELALLVDRAGLSPMQALVAGTRHGAIALGLDDRGTIEVGKVADLVVLEADPLADIRNTTRIRFTFRRGRQVTP